MVKLLRSKSHKYNSHIWLIPTLSFMNKQAIVCCQLTTRQPGWHERTVRQASHLREKSNDNQHIYTSVICPHGNLSHIRHASTDSQTEHFIHKWKQKCPVLIANLYIYSKGHPESTVELFLPPIMSYSMENLLIFIVQCWHPSICRVLFLRYFNWIKHMEDR